MAPEHYFSTSPGSDLVLRTISVRLAGRDLEVTTANGIFSPERIDTGTQVLLSNTPAPPPGGNLLDLGCGWGPVALTLALESPRATVWAVDVNQRALDLVRRNADQLGLDNIRAVTPDEVPADVTFMTIWSNPPIRVGKNELHDLLLRLAPPPRPGFGRLARGSEEPRVGLPPALAAGRTPVGLCRPESGHQQGVPGAASAPSVRNGTDAADRDRLGLGALQLHSAQNTRARPGRCRATWSPSSVDDHPHADDAARHLDEPADPALRRPPSGGWRGPRRPRRCRRRGSRRSRARERASGCGPRRRPRADRPARRIRRWHRSAESARPRGPRPGRAPRARPRRRVPRRRAGCRPRRRVPADRRRGCGPRPSPRRRPRTGRDRPRSRPSVRVSMRTPPRVPTGMDSPSASSMRPFSIRNRPNTRMPLPHISAGLPSALW